MKKKVVLDLASGEGYGTNLIAQHASFVTGVDISPEAVAHAKTKYKKANINFLVGSATAVPLDNNTVDVIVSFETIEHHDEHEKMMEEFRRVLKPDGLLIISSPEKVNYREIDPDNPYHVKELTLGEFKNLLSAYFISVRLYHQRFFDVSFIYPEQEEIAKIEEYTGDFVHIVRQPFYSKHLFNIGICCNTPSAMPALPASFFNAEEYWKKSRIELSLLTESMLRQAVETVRSSYSYRLGNFLLFPLSAVKKWLGSNRFGNRKNGTFS
ncbi:class I SAM-dependent methyltransferase [Flavisolibacter sp. BT320]|nr:class I SAM-dependent methyltransferase [Flavisolibacter longurius]